MKRTITKENNSGMDEWWCRWFTCPNCGEEDITFDFKFCPDCGIKLVWKTKSEDYEDKL